MSGYNPKSLENIKNFATRDPEEARRIQSMGGKASHESRRRRKRMQEAAKAILGMDVPKDNAAIRAMLEKAGIAIDDANWQAAILAAMVNEAARGDVGAASFLRDTAGEGPSERLREKELALKRDELEYKKKHGDGHDTNISVEVNTNPFANLTEEQLRKLADGD